MRLDPVTVVIALAIVGIVYLGIGGALHHKPPQEHSACERYGDCQ